jgi:murein DD-endopeptidase MepM/ murein hydrolase activator NlpD
MHNTHQISESNFITAVNNYCSSNACSSIKSHWDLHAAYRESTKNNMNPMFTVARAFCEGFSPGASQNNYWGLGCGDGVHCLSYSSFSEGVAALSNLRIVKNATYMYDVFSSGYASLGGANNNRWENPGSSNRGGCHYVEYIKPYLSESGKAHATAACAPGVNNVPITDEENKAYYLWNCEKTMQYVTKIFGDYLTSSTNESGYGDSGISNVPVGKLVWPIPNATPKTGITSGFGPRGGSGSSWHHGLDLGASRGTPIISASDGEVCGNLVTGERGWVIIVVDPKTSLKFIYQHMDNPSKLTVGTKVRAGQQIGLVGSKGAHSSGPHLHFEIHSNEACNTRMPWANGSKAAGTENPLNFDYISSSLSN